MQAASSHHEVIDLDSEDEAPSVPARKAQAAGTSDAPVVLDDDDEVEEVVAAAPNPKRAKVAGGAPSSSGVIDLSDDTVEVAPAPRVPDLSTCPLCKDPMARHTHTLSDCGDTFCKACICRYVEAKLKKMLAHEVKCPACGKHMQVAEMQALAGGSAPAQAPQVTDGSDAYGLPAHLLGAMGRLPPQVAAMMRRAAPQTAKQPQPAAGAASSSGFGMPRAAGTVAATKRLMKEMKEIQKAGGEGQGFAVSLPDDSDLYTWDATFFDFERGTPLARDLERVPGKRVTLRIAFPSGYPSSPPYVRVLRPRFAFRTGHVTIGGSICTEMLTSQGWSSMMTMESVLLAIRTNMLTGGARIDHQIKYDYSEAEAREAFNRMMTQHGWF